MMKKSNTSTPTSSISRPNKNLSLLECEQCGIEIVDRPIVAMKCLHRFCSSCTTNLISCPKCGERTAFQLDSNLATLISKINSHRGKLFAKRRILDVLQSDGADLTPPAQRWSRMGMANGRTSKSESPIKPAAQQHSVNNNSDSMVFDEQPSTSSAAFCCNGSSTLAVQTPKGSGLKAEQSSQEFDSWHKTGTPTSSHRVPLHRGLANMETIVLWPDGLNYRLKDLPQCMLRPRYLYVPAIATVAHLAEYLFKRAELEADWKYRYKYRVELMPVEEEREELSLWMNPRRDIDYLARDFKSNLQDLQGSGAPEEEYVLILRKNQEDSYFCTNLIMAHPFKPLDGHRTVGELLLATQQQMQQQQQSCRPNNGRQPTFPNGLTKPADCFGQQAAPMDGEGGPHHHQQFGAGNQLQQQLPTAAEKRPPKFVFRFVPRN